MRVCVLGRNELSNLKTGWREREEGAWEVKMWRVSSSFETFILQRAAMFLLTEILQLRIRSWYNKFQSLCVRFFATSLDNLF